MLWPRRKPTIEQVTLPNPFSKRYLFEPQYKDDIRQTLIDLVHQHWSIDGNGVVLDPIDMFFHNEGDENDNLRYILDTVDKRKLRWKQKAVFWSTWNYLEENRVPDARKWFKSKVRNARS